MDNTRRLKSDFNSGSEISKSLKTSDLCCGDSVQEPLKAKKNIKKNQR